MTINCWQTKTPTYAPNLILDPQRTKPAGADGTNIPKRDEGLRRLPTGAQQQSIAPGAEKWDVEDVACVVNEIMV